MNDNLFEEFCLADPVFFETQSRWDGASTAFAQARGEVPDGWQRIERDVWVHMLPAGHRMPQQGWKIHVSAGLDNAERVLAETHRYCLANRVPFKFLLSRNVLRANNLKYAPRSASGKLVTIYPDGEWQLREVLEQLGAVLDGESGPYILTDLRWGSGPLFVRYGAFIELFCPDENGAQVPALAGPGGTLVPDRRTPVFQVPDWVELPEFLTPHLAARQAGNAEFPYRVETAMHFSNGGGVYLARRLADDEKVVLKEARPHAGLDGADRDAVTRLRVERDALQRLAGVPGVPELYEHRTVWEHEFLVQEYLSGDSLFAWTAENYPLIRATPTAVDVERYAARAVDIAGQVDHIVAEIHSRGMTMGDLHPTNIIVDGDDRVRLTDFELARDVRTPAASAMGYPGFETPHLSGPAADRYAAAALKLWLFLPLVELTALAPAKLATYLDAIASRFPLPDGYVDAIRDQLLPAARLRPSPLPGLPELDLGRSDVDWSAVTTSLAEAIRSSATPQRHDRLFPGDPRQFLTGGYGFGYGAAGVLWALDKTGNGRYPEYEQWLLAAAPRSPQENPGFYDGLCGTAFVLGHFGYTEAVPPLLDRALALAEGTRDISLHSGLAGVGLTALDLAERTGDPSYEASAYRIAARLADAVSSDQPHGVDVFMNSAGVADERLGSRAGLLRGWSGVALLLLRCFERSRETQWLDSAVRAVHRDLDLCLWTPDESLQVDGGFRVLAYLDVGSAGIALAAAEVLAHREDSRLLECLPPLARACYAEFVIDAQLMSGRAGLMAALARLGVWRPELDVTEPVARHLRRLDWHAVPYQGHLAFPGRRLRRLSMDLATGNAGMLLAIDAAANGEIDFLPFLAGTRAPADARSLFPSSVGGR